MATKKATIDTESNEKLVFENGPTVAQVEAWKEELRKAGGNDKLIVVNIYGEDSPFIHRKLMRYEYNEIIDNLPTSEEGNITARTDEYRIPVLNACILWPQNFNFDTCGAGVVNNLFESIMDNSGFIVKETYEL
jgi:hypothetical protein